VLQAIFARLNAATPAENAQIIALRQADGRRGEARLKAMTFLDSAWGQWDHVPAKEQVRFKRTAEADEYESNLKEFTAATDEVFNLEKHLTPH